MIKKGLLSKLTYEQIATECKVHHRTIERDIRRWVESGLFETWIKEEFLRLHPIIATSYPEIAYKEVARLVGKMVTRKAEIKTETKIDERVEVTFNRDALSQDERDFLDSITRKYIKEKYPTKSSSIH